MTYPYLQAFGGHCEADWEKQNAIYMPFLWNGVFDDGMEYGMSAIFTVAGFCAIFAGEYGNDVVLASKFIFITTLLCIITIPIFVMLL